MSQRLRSILFTASALSILLAALLGCKQTVKEPTWTRSKIIASRLDHPSAMTVDDKFIYFVTGGTVASMNAGTNNVMKMPVEGGEPSVIYKGGEKYLPDFFVMINDDRFVYWIAGSSLFRLPKAGGEAEIFSDKFGAAVEMVQDGENFYSKNFAGENSPPVPIYVTNKQSRETKPFTPARQGANGLCIDDEFLYWVESAGIFKMPKKGGEVSKIYSPPNGLRVTGLKMDAENFYFAQADSKGALMKVSKKGGEAIQLAPSINTVKEFELDENNIYFVDNGNYSGPDYYLCKVSKNGGEVVRLDGGYLNQFTVGKNHIYFNDVVTIYSIPK